MSQNNSIRGAVFFLIQLVVVMVFSSFFAHPLYAALKCGGSKCTSEGEYSEYGCGSGLRCDPTSKKCGIQYDSCVGATCVAQNGWDVTAPCTTKNQCTPPGSIRTANWEQTSCSAVCGNGIMKRTCTCGTENNCTAQCSNPVGNCNDTESSKECCTSQPPNSKPVISAIGSSKCSKNNPMSVVWNFNDTGSSCGQAWGFFCEGNVNTFSIKVDGKVVKSGIGPDQRQAVIAAPEGETHLVEVCAENGFGETCSTISSVEIDITAPNVPVPTVSLVQDESCATKYKVQYSWKRAYDFGCAGINNVSYWSQLSQFDSFPNNDFPINGWMNYVTQTTSTSYPGGTTLYAHVRSRDALDNQSSWSNPVTKIIIPTQPILPTIHINGPLVGSYQERIVNGSDMVCTPMSINGGNLTLQPSVAPYVTPICTKGNDSYSCSFTIDSQYSSNSCVSNSITIGMGGAYSGYSSVGWLSDNNCTGSPATLTLTAGETKDNVPLFFTYDISGQGGWFKISNASFTNRTTGVRNNFIPRIIQAFDDSDDTSSHVFSIKNAGIITQQAPMNVGANAQDSSGNPFYASSPNIYANGYTQMNDIDYEKYTQYTEARKNIRKISSLSEITGNGIYLSSVPVVINAAAVTLLQNKNVVILTKGTNMVSIDTNFQPANAAVAFVSPTIVIAPSVTKINAILIAGTISTGESANELKISGNLVSQNVFTLQRKRANPQQPSLFVDFSMKAYIDLLPYLSVSTYDWKQTQ